MKYNKIINASNEIIRFNFQFKFSRLFPDSWFPSDPTCSWFPSWRWRSSTRTSPPAGRSSPGRCRAPRCKFHPVPKPWKFWKIKKILDFLNLSHWWFSTFFFACDTPSPNFFVVHLNPPINFWGTPTLYIIGRIWEKNDYNSLFNNPVVGALVGNPRYTSGSQPQWGWEPVIYQFTPSLISLSSSVLFT